MKCWTLVRALLLICLFSMALPGKKHEVPKRSVPAHSKIFVDTNNGFDTFILAAFQEKGVNVDLVSSADKADYILDSALFHSNEYAAGFGASGSKASGAAGTYRISEAAFKLTSKSGDIVWAYAATKGMFSRGKQSVAEACAKHIKEIVK